MPPDPSTVIDVVREGGGTGVMVPPQSILDKNKDLGSYAKHLPLGDCFLSGLLISGFTKKYNRPTTLFFASDRIVMAQPQCPANGQASFRLFKTNLRWNSIFAVLRTVAYPRGGAIASPPVKLYIKLTYFALTMGCRL